MKIYHGPQNIGGMAGLLAYAQRQQNVDAISNCFPTGNFNFKVDEELSRDLSPWKSLKLLSKKIANYDVFQFYFGESLTGPSLREVPLLKILGKKVFFYFCGCDVRDSKITISKYEFSACQECWPMGCSANRKKAIETAIRYADGIAVSTPDLLEFVKNSILLPQPIDLTLFSGIRESIMAKLQQRTPEKKQKIVIAHAPSNRMLKGTSYVEDAVNELIAANYPIELVLVENMSYEDAMYQCAAADIAIDQLLVGSYGQYSVEMMALGKPVICYIREDLHKHYSADLPIVNANPKTLTSVLKLLLDAKSTWGELGASGQTYVNNVHDSAVVAGKLLSLYQNKG